MNKEPVLLACVVLSWLLSRALEAIGWIPPADVKEALTQLTVLVVTWLIARSQVFSKETLIEAGHDPKQVERDAKDDDVISFKPPAT